MLGWISRDGCLGFPCGWVRLTRACAASVAFHPRWPFRRRGGSVRLSLASVEAGVVRLAVGLVEMVCLASYRSSGDASTDSVDPAARACTWSSMLLPIQLASCLGFVNCVGCSSYSSHLPSRSGLTRRVSVAAPTPGVRVGFIAGEGLACSLG